MLLFDGTEPRLTMADGRMWAARFRHEMTQIARRGSEHHRRSFLYFRDDAGAMRRAAVAEDFAGASTDADLRAAWQRADPWPCAVD